MFKKLGLGSIILGIFLLCFGIWMVTSYNSYDYWGYSSGTRTLMELVPWFLSILGAIGIIVGIFYLIQGAKPSKKIPAKVLEKKGNIVIFELNDGSRKTLTILGNIPLVIGDSGIIEYKGNFITGFNRQ